MTMTKTTARKLIDRGKSAGDKRHHLHLGEHDGQLWATNAYWLAPADWFGEVLPAYGAYGAGETYDVKEGRKLEVGCPNLAHVMPSGDLYDLEPVRMHGRDIIADGQDDYDLRLYTFADADADGPTIALRRPYVDMVRDNLPGYVDRLVGGRDGALVFRSSDKERGLKPVYAYQNMSYTRADMSKSDGLRLVAIIMPVRLS